jgi:hypothetical protein
MRRPRSADLKLITLGETQTGKTQVMRQYFEGAFDGDRVTRLQPISIQPDCQGQLSAHTVHLGHRWAGTLPGDHAFTVQGLACGDPGLRRDLAAFLRWAAELVCGDRRLNQFNAVSGGFPTIETIINTSE